MQNIWKQILPKISNTTLLLVLLGLYCLSIPFLFPAKEDANFFSTTISSKAQAIINSIHAKVGNNNKLDSATKIFLLGKKEDCGVQVFENKQLTFWNSTSNLPTVLIEKDTCYSQTVGNTFFIIAVKKIQTNIYLQIAIPVQDKIKLVNTFLQNKNYLQLYLPEVAILSENSFPDAKPIIVNKNPVAFIKAMHKGLHYQNWSLTEFLFLLSVLPFLFFVFYIFYHLVKDNRIKEGLSFIAVIGILYYIVFYFLKYPFIHDSYANAGGLLERFEHYYPTIGTQSWVGFVWLLISMMVYYFYSVFAIKKASIVGKLFSVLLAVFIVGFSFKLFHFIENTIENSVSNFEVSVIGNINPPTLFGYFLISTVIVFIIVLLGIVQKNTLHVFSNNPLKSISLFVGCIIVFLIFRIMISGVVISEELYFAAFIIGLFAALHVPALSQQKITFNVQLVIWIVMVSIGVTLFIQWRSSAKAIKRLTQIAKQFVPEPDLMLEEALAEYLQNTSPLLSTSNVTSLPTLQGKFAKYIFTIQKDSVGNLQTLFNIGEVSIYSDEVKYLQGVDSNNYSYLVPINSMGIGPHQFLTVQQKSISQLQATPSFLLPIEASAANGLPILLKVNKEILFENKPIAWDVTSSNNSKINYVIKNGYLQVSYQVNNKVCFIAKRSGTIIGYLVLFGFVFSWLFAIVTISLLVYYMVVSKFSYQIFVKNIQLDFHLRMFITLLFMEVLIFVTFLFFVNRFEAKNYALRQQEKLNTEMEQVQDELQEMKNPFSITELQTAFSPINRSTVCMLFDSTGSLFYNSQSVIYSLQLQSKQMPFEALQFFESSKGNQLFYTTASVQYYKYAMVIAKQKSKQGQSYFVAIPLFTSPADTEMANNNLFAPLLDALVGIILLSGLLSFVFSKFLVRKISLLGNSIKKLNINKNADSQITWQYNDEIKPLVDSYNLMAMQVQAAAQQLAETERDNAWREMAKQVAHEIKNPLTPIKLSLQRLDMCIQQNHPQLQQISQSTMATVLTQIEILTNIATNFSQFAKMPALQMQHIDVLEVLQNVVNIHKQSNMACNITLQLDDTTCMLQGDQQQLNRVFQNIFLNAVQSITATQNGWVLVQQVNENDKIKITITDNGIGIREEQQHKIFQPYFTTKSSGTGLGLAMCKDIIEKHNGTISFISIEGQGTTFTIVLPI